MIYTTRFQTRSFLALLLPGLLAGFALPLRPCSAQLADRSDGLNQADLIENQATLEPNPTIRSLDELSVDETSVEAPAARVACAFLDVRRPELDKKLRDAEFARLAQQVSILEQQAAVLRSVVKLVGPSVVHIEAEKEQPDFQSPNQPPEKRNDSENNNGAGQNDQGANDSYEYDKPIHEQYPTYDEYGGYSILPNAYIEEAGSGVLIEIGETTYVLTNRHVVTGCELQGIRIKLHDGRMIYPTKKWEDSNTDVAVLRVEAAGLVPARIGNSSAVEIGDFVLAFGSPFGLRRSVTYGIISAKGRRDLVLGSDPVGIQNFLQTDAAINPGNSGGPLLNTHGEVIGLNTAIASNSGGNDGIGFSIPINIAVHVATQLVDKGELVRAYLGVHLDSAFRSKAAKELGLPRLVGARVTGVTPSSPAEESELTVDDVIVAFNGAPVEDDNHLVNMVGLTPVGVEVNMTVIREGQPKRLVVRLSERQGASDHY